MSEPPSEYKTPPFPSLNVHTLSDETDNKIYTLYHIGDIWRFTVVWTVIVYAVFHMGAVLVAFMTHGFKRRSWKLLWLAPIVYLSVAGVEAVISGSIVGLIVGAVYDAGNYEMNTWVPCAFITLISAPAAWHVLGIVLDFGVPLAPFAPPSPSNIKLATSVNRNPSPVSNPRLSFPSFQSSSQVQNYVEIAIVLYKMSTFEPRLRRPSSPSDPFSTAATTADFEYNRPQPANLASAGLFPGQVRSLSGIALRAFCLGAAGSLALLLTLATLLFTTSPVWRAPFFLLALSTFHFLEFWVTARRNTLVATTDSFLLTANWPAYAIAHASAFVECLVVSVFFPERSWGAQLHLGSVCLALGLALVVVGQTVRSMAMLHAGASFNHQIQWSKSDSHVLVTSGIYGRLRHPSYFGFFYWGLGTQLVLGNVFCFIAYTAVLWYFFSRRIRIEEVKLVEFFKEDYVQYKRRVGTWMPFI